MNAPGQHVITVKPTRTRNYAECTCRDDNDEHWRSPETGSPTVARRAGETHLREVRS